MLGMSQVKGEKTEKGQWIPCSDCMKGMCIASNWRIMCGVLRCNICMDIYFAVPRLRAMRSDVRADMDTPGLGYLSILLSWISGLDWGFAHASYNTHCAHDLNNEIDCCDFN